MQRLSSTAIEAFRAWLVEQALLAPPAEQLVPAMGERAREAGLPIARLHLGANFLHPEVEAIAVRAWDDQSSVAITFEEAQGDDYQTSPFKPLMDEVQRQLSGINDPTAGTDNRVWHRRLHLETGQGLREHPILAGIAAAGATDYLACVIGFGIDGSLDRDAEHGVAASWATRRPGGFSEAEVATLVDLMPLVALAVRGGLDMAIARAVLGTYLGSDAGNRVLAGNIRRGQLDALRAVILYGDLRGFTAVSDRLPGAEVVAILDSLFEAMAEPVLARGGQVMKFMGDAILATFALEDAADAPVCAAALDAAIEAQAAVAAVNARHHAEGKPVMPLDQALHLGTVMYGNVGTRERLDFTVVGPAVNEAARMEALCQPLDVPITVSQSFAEATATPERFRSLGPQMLRGVGEPRQIFTIAAT